VVEVVVALTMGEPSPRISHPLSKAAVAALLHRKPLCHPNVRSSGRVPATGRIMRTMKRREPMGKGREVIVVDGQVMEMMTSVKRTSSIWSWRSKWSNQGEPPLPHQPL